MTRVGAFVPGWRHVEWADTLHDLPREQVGFHEQRHGEPDHDRLADQFQLKGGHVDESHGLLSRQCFQTDERRLILTDVSKENVRGKATQLKSVKECFGCVTARTSGSDTAIHVHGWLGGVRRHFRTG